VSGWLIVAVLAAVAALDTYDVLQALVHQPLVIGTLTGAALGMPLEGAWFGALLQLPRASELPVGTTLYPDRGPVTAGLVGGVLLALETVPGDLALTGVLVLLVALPAFGLSGRVAIAQFNWQESLDRSVRSAPIGRREARLRSALAVGLALTAVRGAVVGVIGAGIGQLLVRLAGRLPLAGRIQPWELLVGVAAAGLTYLVLTLGERRLLPWLLAGAALAGLGTAVL